MEECIFCTIANGQSPAEVEYEDDEIMAIRDIDPQAPVHILIFPKRHIISVNELTPEDAPLIGKMVLVAKQLAQKNNLVEEGYRLVINSGIHAGQTVDHLHMHLLGGKPLGRLA